MIRRIYIDIPQYPEFTHFSSRQQPGFLLVNLSGANAAIPHLEVMPALPDDTVKGLLRLHMRQLCAKDPTSIRP